MPVALTPEERAKLTQQQREELARVTRPDAREEALPELPYEQVPVTTGVVESQLGVGPITAKQSADPELIRLVESRASIRDILEYAQAHPEATRGAYWGGIQEQIYSKIQAAAELEGEEQFRVYQQLGYVPQDAEYVETDTGWGYIPASYRQAEAKWMSKLEQYPELYEAYQTGGIAGYEAKFQELTMEYEQFAKTHVQLPDEQWMAKSELDKVKEQSTLGYNILTTQGYTAYQQAVDAALAMVEPYKRKEGYRLSVAVGEGIPKQVLELIFSADVVDKAMQVRQIPEEQVLEKAKLPPALAEILPAAGAVALVEPTPFGEAVVAAVVVGAAIWYAIQGRELDWEAAWSDIKSTFTTETQREPTTTELAEMEAYAVTAIKHLNIPTSKPLPKIDVKLAPPTEKIEAAIMPIIKTTYEPQLMVGGPAPEILLPSITGHPMPVTKLPMIVGGPTPGTRLPVMTGGPIPVTRLPQIMGGPMPRTEIPQMLALQVATAEKELDEAWTIIRSKILIMEPGKFLPATIPKTETALVALDAAVQDAFTAGEIDEGTLRVYSRARTNYLTKKGLLDAASKVYISGMQLHLPSNIQNLASLALPAVLVNLQKQANSAAREAYNQALAQGLTQTQAITAAQVATQNAIQTAIQVAIQNAVQTVTQAQAITDTATISAVQTAVNTAVNTALATMTLTAISTATGISPPIKLPSTVSGISVEKQKVVLPQGTIAFKMGMFWKYLPPPWTQSKMLTLSRGITPVDAVITDSNSPYDTIQIIGKPLAEVPESISADIGVADVHIFNRGTQIEFARGLDTNVGIRIDKNTEGISVPSIWGLDEVYAPSKIKSIRPTKRYRSLNKKRKKYNRNDFSDLTSLQEMR